jgi:homoserine dehydrogenase
VSVMSSPGMELDPIEQPRFLPEDQVESAFYLHLEVEDRPGVLAQVARVLGDKGVSVKSVVQKGIGENARLVMVMHPVAEGSFRDALDEISKLDLMRAPPRSIRVIEEEFQA